MRDLQIMRTTLDLDEDVLQAAKELAFCPRETRRQDRLRARAEGR